MPLRLVIENASADEIARGFTRKFAPYVDIHYGRKFGGYSSFARRNGEDVDELIGAAGLRLMF